MDNGWTNLTFDGIGKKYFVIFDFQKAPCEFKNWKKLNMKKKLLIIFLVCGSNYVDAGNIISADTVDYRNNPNYDHELELYEIYKTRQADIIMLGNSLTHGVNWNQLLGRNNVVEMGIPGDITEGMFNRLQYVIRLKPKICFILSGLNDIYNWIPVEDIFRNYIRIINLLKAKNIEPVIQSTLYAGKEWGKDWGTTPEINAGRNKEVDRLNLLLKDYASKNNIEFIDLVSIMSNSNFLNSKFTHDGLHLNAKGFKIWAQEVEKVLAKKGL